ncbi:MAG: SIMPL domain-containing protein [Nitrospirae bacterium]|nr:SIMPL domain-containing protein [Nitrospirota bacterium]
MNIKSWAVILLIILLAGAAMVYANDTVEQENELLIISPIEASRSIVPDLYVFSVSVSVISQSESNAINVLGKLDKKVRELGLRYKGGEYSVNKNCWWSENRQVCDGYKGHVYYLFEVDDPSKQNEVLELLSNYKEESHGKIDISISNTTWKVSGKTIKKVEDELKFEVIASSIEFARKVGEQLRMACTISEVNFQPRPTPVYPMYRTMLKERSIEAPAPTKGERTVTVRAEVKVLCR